MLRVTGYGQTGPYKDRPGFARIAHAVGGLAYLAGMPKGTPVTPGSTTLGDYHDRPVRLPGRADGAAPQASSTGEGQYIDVALYESVFRCTDELAPAYAMYGMVRERARLAHIDFAVPLRPLPDQGRQVGGDRLHHRQAVRAAGRRHGPAGAGLLRASTASRRPGWKTATTSTRSSATGAAR